ncbi:hypothetical protein GCM10022241_13370 [Micrococcus endophyticus]
MPSRAATSTSAVFRWASSAARVSDSLDLNIAAMLAEADAREAALLASAPPPKLSAEDRRVLAQLCREP